jgi:SAM-dependent methyltransferase
MVSFQQQGATQMNFPDHSFDAVTAISVLEHISGDGDTSAMSEIYRVLKPGGHLYFTVPCASKYIEEFLPRDVHDQKYDSKPVFFSRLYDEDTLRTHLLDRTPMRVTEKMIFGQPHFDFSRFWWKKFPLPLKLFFCWMSPWLASLFYRQVDSPSESSGISIACFMMRKD